MKIHTQSALIILGTLFIGMILGTVISSLFVHQRFERARTGFDPGRFPDFLVNEIIQPTSDKQRDLLIKIVEESERSNLATIDRFRKEMDARMDSLIERLKPMLTDEQIKRLQRYTETRDRMPPGGPCKPPPPNGPGKPKLPPDRRP